ncbi:hypothetical protein SVIOM74S_09942 [Streptomyces violarus]
MGEVLTVVRDLKDEGMTMVLATHEMAFAREVADQVCFLEGGVVLERGTAEQVFGVTGRSARGASCGGSWRRGGCSRGDGTIVIVEQDGRRRPQASACPAPASAATRSCSYTYPCTPQPAMTPSARSET